MSSLADSLRRRTANDGAETWADIRHEHFNPAMLSSREHPSNPK